MAQLKKINKSGGKGEIKRFLFLFVFIFLTLFIGLNFESFWTNLKYELKELFPGEIKVIGEAAISGFPFKGEPGEIYQKDTILIPKIGVRAPILIPKSGKEKDILLVLKEGVALHPSSALPGKIGITIISGHSSPHIFYRGKYNTVFGLLGRLKEGDEIIIYFAQEKFVYKMIKKYTFLPDKEDLLKRKEDKNILVLVTCWPVGTDLKRIAIEAELIKK